MGRLIRWMQKSATVIRFSRIQNEYAESNMVRLRMIEETAPREDAQIVEPGLEDLFLYHFGEESEKREER